MVISKARQLEAFFKGGADEWSGNAPEYILRNQDGKPLSEAHWRNAQSEAKELAERLERVNPVVIDYFLAQNPALHDIGRLAITLVIFDCEAEFHEQGGNPNHQRRHKKLTRQGQVSAAPQVDAFNDDWLRFVLHRITMGCKSGDDLEQNDVRFVTFNYDVSVEKRLYDGLCGIGVIDHDSIAKFLEGRVIHVYGGVREKVDAAWKPHVVDLPGSPSHGLFLTAVGKLDIAFRASLGIRTIDGPDKMQNQKALESAKTALERASSIYILGYGFDVSNSKRIGLQQLRPENSPASRIVYMTNLGGTAKISRPAGRVLANNDNAFLESFSIRPETFVGNTFRRTSCEMSTKDVYGALAYDFEI